MIEGMIGRKLGMTQLFDDDGKVTPVTVLEMGPCVVVQRKSMDKDGYDAVQVGLVEAGPAGQRDDALARLGLGERGQHLRVDEAHGGAPSGQLSDQPMAAGAALRSWRGRHLQDLDPAERGLFEQLGALDQGQREAVLVAMVPERTEPLDERVAAAADGLFAGHVAFGGRDTITGSGGRAGETPFYLRRIC